jgi:hypothetical protein
VLIVVFFLPFDCFMLLLRTLMPCYHLYRFSWAATQYHKKTTTQHCNSTATAPQHHNCTVNRAGALSLRHAI